MVCISPVESRRIPIARTTDDPRPAIHPCLLRYILLGYPSIATSFPVSIIISVDQPVPPTMHTCIHKYVPDPTSCYTGGRNRHSKPSVWSRWQYEYVVVIFQSLRSVLLSIFNSSLHCPHRSMGIPMNWTSCGTGVLGSQATIVHQSYSHLPCGLQFHATPCHPTQSVPRDPDVPGDAPRHLWLCWWPSR